MLKLLVVDGDPLVHERVANCFSIDNARVTAALDVPEEKTAFADDPPEICLIDLSLPGTSGTSFCEEISNQFNVGVIVLSASKTRHERVKLLNICADDYIVKPFDDLELRARVGALARRIKKRPVVADRTKFGHNKFQFEDRSISREDNTSVSLTSSECRVLRFMLNNSGTNLSRDDLVTVARMHPRNSAHGRSVDNLISRLRQKVEIDPSQPRHIVTIWGHGYRFVV